MTPRFLADTHVVLWSWHGDRRLKKHHEAILRSEATIFVSIASIWEIAIKVARGKLKTVDNVGESLLASGFEILPIALDHIQSLHEMPDHHRDPFDRMLIAQALREGLTVLTTDPAFRKYDVTIA